ncbi:unnamed protein product [Ceutorhynchus assimilis]|uniref:Regulatory protein zeste n=1 Tax=Ceutorhynchus assimilis TaxID=467358 RepID=A0A9N9MI50_9CUCU|nr:unnamed protein product [Ceutorhynchus assimilis]
MVQKRLKIQHQKNPIDPQGKKRQRCNTFSSEEKLLIANVFLKYRQILENKKTGHISTEEKNKVWEKITKETCIADRQPIDHCLNFIGSGSEFVPSKGEGEVNEAIGTSSEEIQEEETRELRPKKHIRHEQYWSRAANAGEEYTTKSGKTVPSKPFLPFACAHKNKFKVVNKLRKYTENENSKRDKTRIYYIPDATRRERKFCKYFFQAVFQVVAGKLDRLLKNKSYGLPSLCDKRRKHPPANKTSEVQKNQVREFIKKFPSYESHYGRPKSNHGKYLAPDLSLGKM